ncbi:glycosyl transferase family 28 [Amorphus orientalis]|uniref:Polysaccharide deacetylase n=1 Tax=Amorphus orientalis TaxID=649198 RepID=A0AAE3VQT4_9HYPH|nr:glycosyl transferase family 28 [Amorphus orientalis]MDQ0317004.1 hypothetical protein [Amorphus orientalis]
MTGPREGFADRLTALLDAAADRSAPLSFWWRDDDAVKPTLALDRLLALAEASGAPLCLAVIPARADRALTDRLAATDATVLQHGWAHANHAAADAKSAELGLDRPIDTILGELSRGHQRLQRLFGERFLPVLVPPWNRIHPDVADHREEVGLAGLSCFKSLSTEAHRLDTHVDPVAWRSGGGFIGWEAAAAALETEAGRRTDAPVPIGILTHHLVQDAETWSFLETLLEVTSDHPGARWPRPEEAFDLPRR